MRYFYSLLILSLSLSAFSKTGDVSCSLVDQIKGLAVAGLSVQCGEKKGYIKNNTKLSKVKLLITHTSGSTRPFEIDTPPGEISHYSKNLNNEWLQEKVKLAPGESIHIAENGLIIDSSTMLYEDHHAKKELGTISSAPANLEYCSISDNEKPMLLIYPGGCGENKLCAMKVKCQLPKEMRINNNYPPSFVEDAVCPANRDGSCPSPTKCALEEEVALSRKSEKPISGSGNSSSNKSGSSKQ